VNQVIYFIRPVGADGPIKIGHTRRPEYRLYCCQACSPVRLEIAAQLEVAGDAQPRARREALHLERRFHIKYADDRLHNEWFAATPELLADIASINAGAFDTDTLPPFILAVTSVA
jgi:hypothetical protein